MKYPLFKAIPPFIPTKDGFGWMGVIMYDDKKDVVQCHLCGEWMPSLGIHVSRQHKIKTKEYRKRFGLLASTQLATPHIARMRSDRQSRLFYDNVGEKLWTKRGKTNRNYTNMRMQEMNRKGTCPIQIEDRFDKIRQKLGTTPPRSTLPSGLIKALYIRYGTYNNFLKSKGLTPNATRLTKQEVANAIKSFIAKYKYFPLRREMNAGLVPPLLSYRPVVSTFGSIIKAQKQFV